MSNPRRGGRNAGRPRSIPRGTDPRPRTDAPRGAPRGTIPGTGAPRTDGPHSDARGGDRPRGAPSPRGGDRPRGDTRGYGPRGAPSPRGDGARGDSSRSDVPRGGDRPRSDTRGGGTRGDGPRGDGSRGDSSRSDVRRGDGPRGDSAPSDGPRSDGARSDGPRGDGSHGESFRSDGPRGDAPRSDGPRRGGGHGDGPRPGDPGERLVYGAGPVAELLARRPKSLRAIWVDPRRADRTTSDPVAAIVIAARLTGIKLEDRDRQTLDRVAGEGARHQGVIAWLGPFEYAHLETLVEKGDEPPLLVALDGVEDPRNLGAILRSAYLLGAGGVIIPDHRAAQVTAVVAKASAGASELLPIAQVGNLVRALDELREHGLWRVAVHATEDAQDISAIDGNLGLVIVLGAEGTGVRPLVAKSCDFHAIIPMARTAVGSFNVSVAASLALYELRRQRTHRPQ